jgi:CHAD domain-containing protein/CYTH domain-containing protein
MSAPDAATLLAMPARQAPRVLALALVDDADAAVQRLVAGADPEPLHDFRVALRRLRSLLRAHERVVADTVAPKLVKRIRDIARATGAGRDREVHLALLDRLVEALPLRHRALLAAFRERIATGDDALSAVDGALADWARVAPKLRAALTEWTERRRVHDDHERATAYAHVVADAVDDAAVLLTKRLGRIHDARDDDGAHRARIAGKQLRYLLQPLAEGDDAREALRTLKSIQDALGAMHDAHTLLARVHVALDDAARSHVAAQADALAHSVSAATVRGPAGDDADEARRLEAQAALRQARRTDPRPALLELARMLHLEVAGEWAHVAPWVTGAGRRALRAQAGTVAARWRADVTPPVEIERKFLLSGLPPRAAESPSSLLRQGYVPGTALVERVRCVERDGVRTWYRTVKLGRGLVRTEVEEETTAAIGEALWALTEGRRVAKRRHVIADGDRRWEVDAFTDRALWLAEIELGSPDERVVIPAWLQPWIVRDVTEESEYTNLVLAR